MVVMASYSQGYHNSTDVMEVTNDLLLICKAHSPGGNVYLVTLNRPRNPWLGLFQALCMCEPTFMILLNGHNIKLPSILSIHRLALIPNQRPFYV